jgi:hypothetical protein
LRRGQKQKWRKRVLMHEKPQRKEESVAADDKDLIVYKLIESLILNEGDPVRTPEELRRQFDAVKERLEGLQQQLGEQYVDSMKERLEILWRKKTANRETSRNR